MKQQFKKSELKYYSTSGNYKTIEIDDKGMFNTKTEVSTMDIVRIVSELALYGYDVKKMWKTRDGVLCGYLGYLEKGGISLNENKAMVKTIEILSKSEI